VDICPEEFHNSQPAAAALFGQLAEVADQLTEACGTATADRADWWRRLREKVAVNQEAVKAQVADTSVPLNYYTVLQHVQQLIPPDSIVVSEGANTMDIGRSLLLNHLPRHRLDAGTFGTMGVGLGFGIAAAIYCRHEKLNKHVICVEGDSAFGFSGMEVETMVRYRLPVTIIIVNNSGIYSGMERPLWDEVTAGEPATSAPPTSLVPDCRYDRIMSMFGEGQATGWNCSTIPQLTEALQAALQVTDRPCVLNVVINPLATRQPQAHDWLTRAKM